MAKKKLLSDKQIHDFLKPYAQNAFKDMVNISHSVIEEFYNDYTPQQYKRVFGFRGGGNYLYKPSVKKTENGFRIEFIYSSDFMTGWHRSDDWAFDTGFINGYHGGRFAFGTEKEFVPQMSPSPYERIVEYTNNYTLRRN